MNETDGEDIRKALILLADGLWWIAARCEDAPPEKAAALEAEAFEKVVRFVDEYREAA